MKEQEWGPVQSKPDRPYGDLQGLYVSDMPDGEEHHNWQDGSEYYGEWRDGQPNGRGIFVSQSGQPVYCYSAAATLLWRARSSSLAINNILRDRPADCKEVHCSCSRSS